MKSKLFFISLVSVPFISFSQVSELDNNSTNTAHYLGWDGTSTIPLNIRHNRNDQRIDFFTNNILRMRINAGNATEPMTGASTAGFVGIGPCSKLFCRLTISNRTDTVVGGFRTWMQTGVFSHESTDNMYVGLRRNGVENRYDAIVSWSDDHSPLTRMDKLRFVFTGSPIGGSGTNPRSMNSVNGYEFMVMTPIPHITNSVGSPIGHIGMGPLFSDANLPQSRLHINAEDNLQAFTQISNEQTGIGPNDGLRMGIVGNAVANANGTALLYNQELRPLLLSSNANTNTINPTTGATNERLRITTIGTPTNLPGGGMDTYNPGGLAAENTRVSISHVSSSPVTRPLSLLHLGANSGTSAANTGWRSWMDVGTLSVQKVQHAYFGMGYQAPGATYQGVDLAWGAVGYVPENDLNNPMPLRFVFTSDLAGGGSPDYGQATGREVARMNSNGWMGIGNTAPKNRLEISTQNVNDPYWSNNNMTPGQVGSSGLRFTRMRSSNLAVENPGDGVLSVDADGNVIYVEDGGGCEWNESGNDLYMGIPGACHTGNTGIGALPANNTKLSVVQSTTQGNPTGIEVITTGNNIGLNPTNYGVRSTLSSPPNSISYGFFSEVSATDKVFGGEFHANVISSGSQASGIGCSGYATGNGSLINNTGVAGYAAAGQGNTGVSGTAIAGETSVGVNGTAYYGVTNYGVIANANQGSSNFGVFTTAPTNGTNDWAIWANGKTHCTSGFWSTSDQNLKQNINAIENPSQILSSINPTEYNFRSEEYPQMSLPAGVHYGVMAQELEEVLPGLVTEAIRPAEFDSLGNMISAAVQFKAVNYTELIPILIAGFKEQQSQIQSLQEQINGCCSAQGGADAQGMQTGGTPQHQQSVTLTNTDKPMLGFASPNPNKGEVAVDYYIPENTAGVSEVLFTDALGRPVQTVRITNKGNGRLNIDTANLAAGQYQYTLIVDGEIIATRKMIRE